MYLVASTFKLVAVRQLLIFYKTGRPMSNSHSKRDFLKFALTGGVFAWIGSIIYPVVAYLKPPKISGEEVRSVKVGLIDEFNPGTGTIFRFGNKPAILIRSAAPGSSAGVMREPPYPFRHSTESIAHPGGVRKTQVSSSSSSSRLSSGTSACVASRKIRRFSSRREPPEMAWIR